MKLVFFNILVVAALAYLFLGESNQTRVKDHFDWAKQKVGNSIPEGGTRGVKHDNSSEWTTPIRKQSSMDAGVSSLLDNEDQRDAQPILKDPEVLSISNLESKGSRISEDTKDKSNTDYHKTIVEEDIDFNRTENLTARGKVVIKEIDTTKTEDKPISLAQPRKLSPEVERRRKLVLNESADVQGYNSTNSYEQDADAREKRTSLRVLAEDMEILFVDKTLK